jgi:ABC-type nitrate/sulfonate/bicarbonate transport system substrate-binding protein
MRYAAVNNKTPGVCAGKYKARIAMAKFVIEPHFRLQEWVAEEKGYFRAENLDYEFRELIRSTEGQHHNKANEGAFQSIEQGRKADVSCACHWTVNVAASRGHAKLYADLYSVAPSGIFVAPGSTINGPAELAGVPISVGFQSGSHYSVIQALEQYMAPNNINLTFEDGMLFRRMELLFEGKSQAAALFNGPYYLAEQLGYRKIIDTTFMISAMINGDPDPEDVRRYFRALKNAQRDIDLRPELYTHYYKNEFPDRFHAIMDTRRWGPGERIVFEPYSRDVYEQSLEWIAQRGIFEADTMGPGNYDSATISLATG